MYSKIRAAADKGKSEIAVFDTACLLGEVEKEVLKQLENEGYHIQHQKDWYPDCVIISW
jgi:hypothetical protein